VYLALAVVPLFALRPDTTPPGTGFVRDFAMALGDAAPAMLDVQFALSARLRRATAPFGIDLTRLAAARGWRTRRELRQARQPGRPRTHDRHSPLPPP
jgi:hypothetical protein